MSFFLARLALVFTLKLVFTNLVYATSFQPVPLEKMLAPANAIVVADFMDSHAIELEDGTIATEARFRLEKEWGIEAEEYGISEIKVFFPGGEINGKGLHVEGAPRFVSGEKNILLLSQQDDGRFWVQGLAMGTFKVVRAGQETLIINSIFPNNTEISQITLDAFLRKVAAVKSSPVKEIASDKYARELVKSQQVTKGGPGRSIASTEEAKHEPNVLDSFWLVTMLTVMGVCVAWKVRRKASRN